MSQAAAPVVVVAEAHDWSAQSVVAAINAQVPGLAAHVSPDDLARARWEVTIDADGVVTSDVRLAQGALTPAALWCRAERLAPAMPFGTADTDYAHAELSALLGAWLVNLDRVCVNRPDGQSCSGPSWSPARWRATARTVGLITADPERATSARMIPGWSGPPWRSRLPDSSASERVHTVQVTGQRVTGPVDADQARACLELAKRANCRLLTIDLDGSLRMLDAHPAGAPASAEQLVAIADYLGRGAP